MARIRNNLELENTQIIFKNFSGRRDDFNAEGNRHFSIVITDRSLVEELIESGYNVKRFKETDENNNPDYYLQVKVKFGDYSPTIKMITGVAKVNLNEDTVCNLDNADIAYADLIITPYHWERQGRTGTSAYLKTGYFVLEEDRFASKYNESNDDEIPFN